MEFVFSGVQFAYEQDQAAPALVLKQIDLNIRAGELLCIVGPSGCGKTTLLNLIAGFLKPTAGTIELKGISASRRTPPIAIVFQEYALFPWRPVIDNVSFGLEMTGSKKKDRYAVAERYLDLVGLSGYQSHYPHQLSGGMKQRVAIARALANDPEVLVMDEPLGSLDPQTRMILQRELVRIWEQTGKTIIYVTHSIDEAVYLGDRVIVLSNRPTVIREEIPINLARPRGEAAMAPFKEMIWSLISPEITERL